MWFQVVEVAPARTVAKLFYFAVRAGMSTTTRAFFFFVFSGSCRKKQAHGTISKIRNKSHYFNNSSKWIIHFIHAPPSIVYPCPVYSIKLKHVSCDAEDFVGNHLCKLRGIIRSSVNRVLCDLIKDISPYYGEQNLTALELSVCRNMWLWIYIRQKTYFVYTPVYRYIGWT